MSGSPCVSIRFLFCNKFGSALLCSVVALIVYDTHEMSKMDAGVYLIVYTLRVVCTQYRRLKQTQKHTVRTHVTYDVAHWPKRIDSRSHSNQFSYKKSTQTHAKCIYK